MSTPEQEISQPKSKTIIIVALIVGAIAAIALTVFAVFFFNAPTTKDPNTGQKPGEPISSELVPNAQDFNVVQRAPGGLESDYTFTVSEIKDALIVEYRLEDNQFNVLDSGTLTEPGTIKQAVLLKDTTTGTNLMFRVVSGKDSSEWVNVGSVSLSVAPAEEAAQREVNEAYYQTDWALKKDISVAALQEAFEVAFGATTVKPEEYGNCYLGNSETLLPGEIVRPRPDLGTQYDLKTYIIQVGEKFNVDFVWCEK